MMTRYERIKEALENMTTADLVAIHNEYCDAAHYYDNHVYSMEDFDEIMEGTKPWEVVRSAFFGDFNPCRDYFRFNGYGNLESFDFIGSEGCPICIEDIAEYIDNEGDALYSPKIEEILA